ncbi:MAG: hypothetical protein Q7S22_07650 [Candidatus Micrarchaeota archaeon]|nr:hypothetical protein [Candidatus Micrarchaeota archaeon]
MKLARGLRVETQGKLRSDTKEPLGEGLAKLNVQIVVLDKREFKIPLDSRGRRNWKLMTEDQIVDYARAYCKEKRITRSSGLEHGPNKDNSLYIQLNARKIVGRVFERNTFEEVTLQGRTFKIPLNTQLRRDWQSMPNDEIVDYAKAYCKEKGIAKPSELTAGSKKDTGLCHQLQQRKLMNRVFERNDFEKITLQGRTFKIPLNAEGKRNWKAMSDAEIVDYAKAYCAENGITKPQELREGPDSDYRVYIQIRRRKLTARVFTDIQVAQEASALTDLASALQSFGGSEK